MPGLSLSFDSVDFAINPCFSSVCYFQWKLKVLLKFRDLRILVNFDSLDLEMMKGQRGSKEIPTDRI